MALEINKKDFEKALSEMESLLDDIKGMINGDILDILGNVITEYNNHYEPDIGNLIEDNERLQEIINGYDD